MTQSLLLLVEDINDNEPIFKPYKTALEVPENSGPGIITTVEATDRDEGAYGQVRNNISLIKYHFQSSQILNSLFERLYTIYKN